MERREFLRRTLTAACGLGAAGLGSGRLSAGARAAPAAAGAPDGLAPPFRISIAEWALVGTHRSGKLSNLDFPAFARKELGIDCVEHVDQFFPTKAGETGHEAYLAELKKRCDSEGVRSGLIMIDTAGALCDPDASKRAAAVEKHKQWLESAKALGCRAMRVNAWGSGSPGEMRARMVESGAKLAERGAELSLDVVIENHGGPSSDPWWLAGVMEEVGSPWFGTLPDFGNFPGDADRFAAVAKLMPFARGVSSKGGRDTIPRMMSIVLDAGYRGYVGIESGAGSAEGEVGAILEMKRLLEEIRAAAPVLQPIWNGRDLEGWETVDGGDWTVEDGALVGRNGRNWTTDPAKTGSWLRTGREYADFELYLEVSVGPRSNSGIFLRAGPERNPAFTGYEIQLVDAAGRPPSRGGPCSLYDFAAPRKNPIRPAGEWNEIRVIAKGPSIRVHVNGAMVHDVRGDRNSRGFIGLQAHDERSYARFRNILLAEI